MSLPPLAPSVAVIWLHGDHLNPASQIWQHYPASPAIWVWDEALLQAWGISFKRLVFIYECLLELPVEIRRGDVVTELEHFCQQHQASQIITSPSPSPRFQQICQALSFPVTISPAPAFVTLEPNPDLKRFSRYWRLAKPQLLTHYHAHANTQD